MSVARTFNNNVANYMTRASVTLGLNGLTECSFACWCFINAYAAIEQVFVRKNQASGIATFDATIESAGTNRFRARVENNTLAQFPEWWISTSLPTGFWKRVLFTLKVNNGDSTDGIFYVNGDSVPVTFSAGGYATNFTIGDDAAVLLYGRNSSGTRTLNGRLAWMTVWNRQLTAQEALDDYHHPRNVLSGLIHSVPLCPDGDMAPLGNHMSVVGALDCTADPPVDVSTGDDDGDSFQFTQAVA